MYQIMLVEDEALVRESMAQNTNWEKFGFSPPHVFENGRQAADHLETVLPDVVITDICMPFLDGLELAKLLNISDLQMSYITNVEALSLIHI